MCQVLSVRAIFIFFPAPEAWDLLVARDVYPYAKLALPSNYFLRGGTEHHTFSAFWLRSSVVSVLISLISGTWRMASHEFK